MLSHYCFTYHFSKQQLHGVFYWSQMKRQQTVLCDICTSKICTQVLQHECFEKCGALEQSAYYKGFGLDRVLPVVPLMPVKVFSSVSKL